MRGVVGVTQPESVIGQRLPGIDARPVGTVKIGLQTFTALQFDVREDEIQLEAALVLMLDPQAVVLVFVETGHQCLLPLLHQPHLFRLRNVRFLKRQDA